MFQKIILTAKIEYKNKKLIFFRRRSYFADYINFKEFLFMSRSWHTLVETKYCSPKCRLFKCVKRAVIYQGNRVWCRWTDDECMVANCSYATCVKRRLLPGGVCGESVKRRTVDKRPEETLIPSVRLKGKALRKLGEKEIF